MRFLQMASVVFPVSIAVGVVLVLADGPFARVDGADASRAPSHEVREVAAEPDVQLPARAEPAVALVATREASEDLNDDDVGGGSDAGDDADADTVGADDEGDDGGGATLRGRVVPPVTVDVADVRLYLSYVEGGDDRKHRHDGWPVAPNGRFKIAAVAPGALVVVTACAGEQASGATLPLRMPPNAGAVVEIDVPLIARASCTIRLSPLAAREPTATPESDESDRRDPEESISIARLDRGEEFHGWTSPDDTGNHRFTDLPAGRYEARLNAGGCDDSGRITDGVPLGTFELAAGEDRALDFERPGRLRVAGRFIAAERIALDHGCVPTRIDLTLSRPGVVVHEPLDDRESGRFCFPWVPPGRYELTASVECLPLEVEAGDEAVLLCEVSRGIVAGSIAPVADGQPVAVLTCANGDTKHCLCHGPESEGGDWSFEFDECGPGPLRLEIVAPGCRLHEQTLRAPLAMERLDVGRLVLAAAAPLAGTLVDERGAPLAGVPVRTVREWPRREVDRSRDRDAFDTPSTETDADGSFELPFEPRLADFELWLDGDEGVRLPVNFEDGRLWLRLPRLHDLRATIVTADGTLARDVTLRLAPGPGRSTDWSSDSVATTDDRGRCTIRTRACGLVELTSSTFNPGLKLDVDPFVLDEHDHDLGTLVLRR